MPGEVLARFRENKRGEAPVNCTLCLQWLGMDEHTSFVEAEVNRRYEICCRSANSFIVYQKLLLRPIKPLLCCDMGLDRKLKKEGKP